MSGHRARSSSRSAPPFPSVPTSYEALALAKALARRFDFAHAAVVLDGRHRVCDLTPFTDRNHHTIQTAIDWAWCMFSNHDDASKLLLVSVDARSVQPRVREATELYILQSSFASEGIELLDWIWKDGNGVHSLAYANHTAVAWPTDPPELRAQIAALLEAADREEADRQRGAR